MQNMNNTSTTTTSAEPTPSPSEDSDKTFLTQMGDLVLGQQAMAMDHLNRDRCLLRRDMKASQNRNYELPQEDLPECEDDMGVQVGDNKTSTTTNNYYGVDPDNPQPQPPPLTPGKLPPWLIVALLIPWIILTSLLIGWLLNKYGGGDPRPLIGWELDIDTPPEPEPITIQPAGPDI